MDVFDVDCDDIINNKTYIIQLKSDAEPGSGVTWWFSPENSGKATVNGNVIVGGFAWKLMQLKKLRLRNIEYVNL